MASLFEGFEYDVFVSYRHNDNRSGWVTEFVNALKEELATAFKEPISVYFDSSPHDGLSEIHNVDKSLEGKLKCLIFIPVLSQTYCDEKSFAWKHEFSAFNRLANQDRFGRDIRLKSGNVASRILPVQIHELDPEDKATIEQETGSVLRSVEFIYQSAGVVRPLLSNEIDPKANLRHTYYRDQVNKVVRGIKEMLTAMKSPAGDQQPTRSTSHETVSPTTRKRLFTLATALLVLSLAAFGFFHFGGIRSTPDFSTNKSIAVIPFTNMNNDPDQDYLSDGVAEDILNHLVKIKDLSVKSRTSTLQYKNTTRTIQDIGRELGVGSILEGSVRKVGDKLRIVVQLIDVKTDVHLWSETYDMETNNVLTMSSEIALEVAEVLQAKLTDQEKSSVTSGATSNSEGYDYFLRARQRMYSANTSKSSYLTAMVTVDKAISLDPALAQAYALKGQLWFILGGFGVPPDQWRDSSLYYATKAIDIDRQQPEGYVVRGNIYRALSRNKEAKNDLLKAYELAPNNSDVLNAVGYLYLDEGNKKGADMILRSIEQNNSRRDASYFSDWFNVFTAIGDTEIAAYYIEKLREIDPGSANLYWNSSWTNRSLGNFDAGVREAELGFRLNPESYNMIDNLGWAYYDAGKFEKAEEIFSLGWQFEKKLPDTTQRVPFRHRLGMAKLKLGKKAEAEKLFKEQVRLSQEQIEGKRGFGVWGGKPNAFFDLASALSALGNNDQAVQYLDSAFTNRFGWYDGYSIDPLFKPLQDIPAYKRLVARVKAEQKFRQEAFREALNNLEASKEIKSLLKK